ncbi:MAG: chemotaxis protein CheA [Sulfurihydrogenibium sp.]|jgi:two-component system chemotaxis sensor kinase CheA|uniref:chemotaxis protein CheA n=1 Tax=Sulfurihydrogenibium sp. TaxID=2053621 RepID=UPI000CB7644F|nr:MAG: chemotaxis protein CheA [Sulfurihydrogenibium sp.]
MIPDEIREIFDEFVIEASEHLDNLESVLLELERDPENNDLINSAFRSMHTLKGGAGFLGLTKIVEVAHKAEDILGKVKENKMKLNSEILDVLLQTVDYIKSAISYYRNGEEPEEPTEIISKLSEILGEKQKQTKTNEEELTLDRLLDKYGLSNLKGLSLEEILEELVLMPPNKRPKEIIDYIENLINGPQEEKPAPVNIVTKVEEETTKKMLEMVEEEITEKDLKASEETLNQQEKKVEEVKTSINQKENKKPQKSQKKDEDERVLRIDVQKIENLMNLVGELVLDRNRLIRTVQDLVQNMPTNKYIEEIEAVASSIDKVVGDLQLAVMKTRMQPVKRLFQKFSRVVRDLSKLVGKEVNLVIEGEDTEMDKSILEKLEEPLVHLIRNALDHGLETPEERIRLGKPPVGKLILRAYYQGDRVYLEVEDDGRGIDPAKVAKKALEKGLITKEQLEKMTEKEILQLVFIPGFSTKDKVSEISGRGVGMDAVMNMVINFRGTIDIWSEKGKGTKISMAFPLTVGIIRSLLVSVSGRRFAIPIFLVTEIISVENATIQKLSGREVLLLREKSLPLINIYDLLKVPPCEIGYIIICLIGNQRIAFTVEDLYGDEEIVIKPLGKIFGNLHGISGATITGDGKIVLILDIVELLKNINNKALKV